MTDTIAAIATGTGVSAIGIIRMSGPDAIRIADRVFTPYGGARIADAADRKLYYGELVDLDGDTIDICLCTVSRGPGSYTGEDTAEFQCHGSPVVLAEGLSVLFACGARQATRGEFTKRAFLNGRMDLSQAEAVVDIIDAETIAAAKNAAGQLKGAIGSRIETIYSSLVDIMAHFHAVLDYPDEDIDDFRLADYISALEAADTELGRLLATFERGCVLRDGVRCAIVGRPNTGKSSLLNALLGYDRAIVTDIAGTTRDTIEEKIRLKGALLRLVDTAGIRRTGDEVERIGVERSYAAAKEAELVLAVFDGSQELDDEDRRVLELLDSCERAVAVINKCDLEPHADADVIKKHAGAVCTVSALTGQGLDELERVIGTLTSGTSGTPAGEVLTNARHADAVSRADTAILRAADAMREGVTPDAVLTEVEDAMSCLGEITGRTVREDITDRIFERFCVGK